ncbi:hypothetical protein QTP88_013066 [Uroleucon formosanum]
MTLDGCCKSLAYEYNAEVVPHKHIQRYRQKFTRPALFILRIAYHLPASKIFWQVLNISTNQSTFQERLTRAPSPNINALDFKRSDPGLMYVRVYCAIHWSFVNHSSSWTIKPSGMNP